MIAKALRFAGLGLLALPLVVASAWAVGAIYFDLASASLRAPLAAAYGAAVLACAIFVEDRRRAFGFVALAFVGVLGWWFTIAPRQERDWKSEVAVLANAVTDGDRVIIQNVRNFEYRTETDFTPHYDNRAFDLRQLRGVDLFVTYWGSALIAHPILSFDFGEQGRICFSIETRSERGESYSALRGFYRQYELIYIAADERDVIRLRTSFRKGEDVYLYHLNLPLEEARSRFVAYARRIKELHARPEWYNALTTNCTTSIRSQASSASRGAWDWRILANGKADEMLYERGILDRTVAFAALKRSAQINQRAAAVVDVRDFSERIRTGSVPP